MAQPVIQTAFHAGEFSPSLFSRVDLQKYHAGAALLQNWYVDYRGGVSTRMGTKYVIQAWKSATAVRLIPFQASFTVNYAMEFGDGYIRFHRNGAPVLEASNPVINATATNPLIVTLTAPGNTIGETIFISNVGGMTQLNNRFFQVIGVAGSNLTLGDLNGNPINASTYSAYTSGGDAQRVYTLPSPYLSADLPLLKWAQNVNQMVICHPDYPPYVLTLNSATDWTITPIVFGSTVGIPTSAAVTTTLAAGSVNYSYVVTAVDANGQESGSSLVATLASRQDLRTTAGTNRITWNAVSGAVRYNVYKAELSYTNAVALGATHGFIGDATGVAFDDSNIAPDFQQTPPVPQNPFLGAGVSTVNVTNAGTYTTVPVVTFSASSGGQTATGAAVLKIQSVTINNGGLGWTVGDTVYLFGPGSVIVGWTVATSVGGGGVLTGVRAMGLPGTNPGSITSGTAPTGPLSATENSNGTGANANVNLTWGVGAVVVNNGGSGYTSAPTVTFSSGAATATAVLASGSAGNPTVPIYWQQRLGLFGPEGNPQQFNLSQPGAYYNFDVNVPIQPDNAITGTLVSGQLNTIKAAVPMPSGLIILSDQAAWQLYGDTPGSPPSAVSITAQSQAYNGANDVPPIVANFDVLYVQSKGSSVRNLTYNFYTNIYTGTDISVLSSHLFFGRTITEWAWAEEPFKIAWVIRDDGVALSLTFLKEQELIGWAHSTTEGDFKSVCTITEQVVSTAVNAPYFVVERDLPGVGPVKYIERMADRFFTDYITPWCVDSGLQYNGVPKTNFSGAEHLGGFTVTGLADGIPIEPFVMPTSGFFTLGTAASVVTVGLAYEPLMQTLRIDTGNPTIQGKMKLLNEVTLRVDKALGLEVGKTLSTMKAWKDLRLGNVSTMQNAVITDLVTGDARQGIDPQWDTAGQFYIRQPLPYPATVTGVIPELSVGDTAK